MKKKFLFLMLIAVLMLMFTACGGTLDTTVNLNSDLSGSRVMVYTITKSDFNEYVNGDIASVDATIQANLPESLSYVLTEDEEKYIATFTMEFTSLEDEAAKAQALMGSETELEVDFLVGDSVFNTGFVYEEGWYSDSVMSWFETLMINSGYVSSGDEGYIFENNYTHVCYGGQMVDGSNYISVSTMSYIPIEEIRIFTDVNPDGTYNRTIELDILDANLLNNETEIKAFMDESVPSGTTGEWTADLGLNTHRVTIENVTADQMQAAMNTYTHRNNSVFKAAEPTEEDYMQQVLFAENACYEEHLNMSAYGCNSSGTVEVFYYLNKEKVSGEMQMAEEELEGELNYYMQYSYLDENYPEYYRYDLYEIREVDIDYNGQYFYHFGSGTWDTEVKGADKITRKITLVFDDGTTEEQCKVLVERIEEYIAASEEKIDAKIKSVKSDEGLLAVELTLEGSAAEIANAHNYLTNTERSDAITCVEENKWLGFKETCIFEESVNFVGLVNTAYGEEYWAIPVSYTLDMPGSNPNKDLYDETEYDAKKGLIIDTVYTNDSEKEGALTNKLSFQGLLWILVLLLSIISFLVGVVMIVLGIIKKSKAKKAGEEPDKEEKKDKKDKKAKKEAKTEEIKEEVKAEEAAEEVKEEAKAEEVAEEVKEEAKAEEVAEEVKEETKAEELAEEVKEEAKAEQPAEEVKEEAKAEEVAEEAKDESATE